MIWPEFEDDKGNIITDTDSRVKTIGTACMWITIPKMRQFHRDKIKIGLKGYFMEGSRRVAECEVIEIIALQTNPTE